MELTERELNLLLWAIHMADSEGGWEWPDLADGEIEALYTKLGGTVVHHVMDNGTPSSYLESPGDVAEHKDG